MADILRVAKTTEIDWNNVSCIPCVMFMNAMACFMDTHNSFIRMPMGNGKTVVLFCIPRATLQEIIRKVDNMSDDLFTGMFDLYDDVLEDEVPERAEFLDTLMIMNWWSDPKVDHILFEYELTD